ncbi:MAG: Crp/Fnr family transcriptional regulator [Rhodospirillaceae bacterium]
MRRTGAPGAPAAPLNSREDGEAIFMAGEAAADLFVLKQGAARVIHITEDGHRRVIEFIFPDDLFELSESGTYKYTIEAIGPVKYCRIAVPASSGAHKDLRFRVVNESLMQRLSDSDEHICVLNEKHALKKIIAFILMLSDRSAGRGLEPDCIALPMSRGDIGDYLNLRVETVSRWLTHLKSARLISMKSPNAINIIDHDALVALRFTDNLTLPGNSP